MDIPVPLILSLPNFAGFSDCLRRSLNDGKFLTVHAIEHGVNVFPLFTLAILHIWIEEPIYGNIKQGDKLVKSVEAGMLASVLNVHDGTRSTVYKLGQVFLRPALSLSLALDLSAQGVEVKPSGVLVHFHITPLSFYISGRIMKTKCSFIF